MIVSETHLRADPAVKNNSHVKNSLCSVVVVTVVDTYPAWKLCVMGKGLVSKTICMILAASAASELTSTQAIIAAYHAHKAGPRPCCLFGSELSDSRTETSRGSDSSTWLASLSADSRMALVEGVFTMAMKITSGRENLSGIHAATEKYSSWRDLSDLFLTVTVADVAFHFSRDYSFSRLDLP